MICKSRATSARRQGTSLSPIPTETIGVCYYAPLFGIDVPIKDN
jgi:hypothetical protein